MSQDHSRYESDSQSERREAAPLSGVVGNVDTYYVYANDNKLMAEYDNDGNCTREYIYLGDTLLAEYRPQIDATYYYSSDQIRSSRLITDEYGAVVYSAAHGPFGEELATWLNTYDPKLKFSGKEREEYSGQDYFGARYYDSQLRRFMSVDPVVSKPEAYGNPLLWNLYAYSRNSPLSFSDSDGRQEFHVLLGQGIYSEKNKSAVENMGGISGNVKVQRATKENFEKLMDSGTPNTHVVIMTHTSVVWNYSEYETWIPPFEPGGAWVALTHRVQGTSYANALNFDDGRYTKDDLFVTGCGSVSHLGCASHDLVPDIIKAGFTLSVVEGGVPGTRAGSRFGLSLIYEIMTSITSGMSPEAIAARATKTMQGHRENRNDRIAAER
jgi:RHS repeat-associated protein